jgi:arylsulfatase A-like enzyme
MVVALAAPTLAQADATVEGTALADAELAGEAAAPGFAEGVQPDVVVLMLDDLGYIPNDRVLRRLPNIRRIFLCRGKRFTRAYNEIPLCCPARANFHSGQHSLNNGIVVNTWFGFDNSRTLATAMDEAGYHTLFLGKYMNDYDGSTVPAGWDKAHIDRGHILGDPEFWKNGVLTTYEGRFFDDVTRTKAVAWLKRAPVSEPVFQVISPYAPHRHKTTCTLTPAVMKRDRGAAECRGLGTFMPPSYTTSTSRDPYPTRVPRAWEHGWPLKRTCESLLVMDRLVGQLESAQQERGRPFYFLLLSDNGMSVVDQ